MSEPIALFNLLVTGAILLVSIFVFPRPELREKLIFCPRYILGQKQWYRLFSSSFIHADWLHLLFNVYSLYLFGRLIEQNLGPVPFGLIYFTSILGGSLLSLILHRHHHYHALGASGGVCGVIFAAIFLFPGLRIYVFPIPLAVPSWLYALLFILASFYGIRAQQGHIGHDAHLGGAVFGLLTTTVLYPGIVTASPVLYTAVLLLSVGGFLYLVCRPVFLTDRPSLPHLKPAAPDRTGRLTQSAPALQTAKLDAILDKISKSGLQSLTQEELALLRNASRPGANPFSDQS